MVNLLDVDPSLGVRGAAAKAAAGMQGKLSTHVERLRRQYRKLQRRGQLPKPQSGVDRNDELRKLFRLRDAQREDARRKLADAENEAESLGLKLAGENLVALTRHLENVISSLELLKLMTPEALFSTYINRGIDDAEKAIAAHDAEVGALPALEKKLEVLRTIRRLRFFLGVE